MVGINLVITESDLGVAQVLDLCVRAWAFPKNKLNPSEYVYTHTWHLQISLKMDEERFSSNQKKTALLYSLNDKATANYMLKSRLFKTGTRRRQCQRVA